MGHYLAALRLRPNYPEALFNLGIALASRNQFADGLKCVEQANRLTHESNPIMLAGLANLYARLGRVPDAKRTGGLALQIAATQSNVPLIEAISADLVRYGNGTGP
jgi:tetratricopeptide (TPR) repeat protein